MFRTRVAWMCLTCLLLCKEEDTSPVFFAITEIRDIDLYEGILPQIDRHN